MEKVQISMNAEGDQKTFRRYVERALQWRLWQDVFGHHRVDKPRYYDKEDEINRCLKFGFFAACVLTVLHLIMYGWVLTWTSSSCEDISGFPETCPMWKFIYYKLWEYWSDSIGPNGIALLAIFTALLTVGVLAKTNVTRDGILTWLRSRQPFTVAGNVYHVWLTQHNSEHGLAGKIFLPRCGFVLKLLGFF